MQFHVATQHQHTLGRVQASRTVTPAKSSWSQAHPVETCLVWR
jgi:hypothetical protein